MIIEEFQAKNLVKKIYPSLFLWADYTLNPYQGCYHDCKYCDGKSEGYYMHSDFAERIHVKSNAVSLLTTFFKKNIKGSDIFSSEETKNQKLPFTIFIGGGVCDVYQPVEKKIRLTREILQAVYDYGASVILLTKNANVLEDIDLLKKINKATYASVNFTITLYDDNLQKIFEPRASSTTERFNAIKTLRNEGIDSGIYFLPILPFIGDTDENISQIVSKAREVKASFVYSGGLTLKPGKNKNEFFSVLKEYFPKILPKYELLYSNNNRYGILDYKIARRFKLVRPEIKVYKYLYENKLDYAPKRYIPEDRMASNLKIVELLLRIAYIKETILGLWKDAYWIKKDAYYIENYKRDILDLKREELLSLPITKITFEHIVEYLAKGYSAYLSELESLVYRKSGGIKYERN